MKKVMDKMKKKKSSGWDEIGQNFLLLGIKIIAILLTRIINNSIENGEFQKNGKELRPWWLSSLEHYATAREVCGSNPAAAVVSLLRLNFVEIAHA